MKGRQLCTWLVLFVFFCMSFPAMAAQGGLGTMMIDAQVVTLSGQMTSLTPLLTQDRAGRYTLMVLWATTCGYCTQELKDLVAHLDDLNAMNVDLLAVSIDKSVAKVEQYVKRFSRTFPVVVDTRDKIMPALLLRVVPSNLLISSEGKILMKTSGPTTYGNLSLNLKSVIQANEKAKAQ